MSEAKTVTVLFTDMVGSTDLLARRGDERFDLVRRAHIGVLRDALSAHGGAEVKPTGDGLMAVFDSASDAASAAVAMQGGIERLNQRRPDEAAPRLHLIPQILEVASAQPEPIGL